MLITLLLAALAVASAQSVEASLQRDLLNDFGAALQLRFEEVAVEGGTVGLRLGLGPAPELGLRLRQAGSFGPLGNVIASLATDGSTAGGYRAEATLRGVLGPAALRLRASAYDGGSPPGAAAEPSMPPLPHLGEGPAVVGLELGGSYRASRSVLLSLDPALFLRAGELGGSLRAELRWLRARGDDNLSLRADAFAVPGFDRGHVAVGVAYTLSRRRAPSWTFGASAGGGSAGWWPGARLTGSERIGPTTVSVDLALEPYRVDAWPLRAELGLTHSLGEGELRAAFHGGLERDAGWQLGGRLGYAVPFRP